METLSTLAQSLSQTTQLIVSQTSDSPTHHTHSIYLMEDDDDLSGDEQVLTIKLFASYTVVADSYIAI